MCELQIQPWVCACDSITWRSSHTSKRARAYLVFTAGAPALAVGASPRVSAGGTPLATVGLFLWRCVQQCELTSAVARAPPRVLEATVQDAAHVLRTTLVKQRTISTRFFRQSRKTLNCFRFIRCLTGLTCAIG